MNKIKQKYSAFNTQLFFVVAMFLVFLVLSICAAVEREVGLAIGFALATLLPIFVFLISPLYVVFSDEEIEIVYILGQREVIKWNSVRSISLNGAWISRGSGLPHYVVAYPTNEKRPFFVRGEIPKTRKTKRYIKKYYKKDII